MKTINLRLFGFGVAVLSVQLMHGQTPAGKSDRIEFEAASIRASAPATGFHFGGASSSTAGGPGSSDPETFRCSGCTLSTLISKAFQLEKYQLPAQASLTGTTFDVSAKIREGATPEEFRGMLQNLLKERFGLVYHFEDKSVRGYRLVVAKGGPKLKESSDAVQAAAAPSARPEQRRWTEGSGGGGHSHTGVLIFNGQARFNADHQRLSDVAELVSTQLLLPVEDQTGLGGKYDISLNWAADAAPDHIHADGGNGGAGHDHGDAPSGGNGADSSAPPLADALQLQLGLKLVAAEKTTAKVLIVDHVEKTATAN